jgi:hypothetical protein
VGRPAALAVAGVLWLNWLNCALRAENAASAPKPRVEEGHWVRFGAILRAKVSNRWHRLVGFAPNRGKSVRPQLNAETFV